MTEEELKEKLETCTRPVLTAQKELAKIIMNAVNDAFQIGIEVGEKLPKE